MAIKDNEILKNKDFEKVADSVRPDTKKRVTLQHIQIQKGVTYHIYKNQLGQILLDPQVTIPASELWLFNNADALKSVKQGLIDSAQGRISKVDPDLL